MGRNGNVVDMLGKRAGNLLVLSRAGFLFRGPQRHKLAAWRCRCDCGQIVIVRGDHLRSGGKKACGINGHYFRLASVAVTKEERRIWNAMMQRCYNAKTPGYKSYGAQGIKVCERWRTNVESFIADMGPRPSSLHSIDRYPEPAGDYEPKNCRWATKREQNLNKRTTVRMVIAGEIVTVIEYCEHHGLDARKVRKRLGRGWSVERALSPDFRPPR